MAQPVYNPDEPPRYMTDRETRRWRQRYASRDEHWSLIQNGYPRYGVVIHNAIDSLGDVGGHR